MDFLQVYQGEKKINQWSNCKITEHISWIYRIMRKQKRLPFRQQKRIHRDRIYIFGSHDKEGGDNSFHVV